MFACYKTLISQFSHSISKKAAWDSFHNISFFHIFLTYYLSICYSLCESLIKPDEATKSGKSTTTSSKLLFAKIFSLNQKKNQIVSATLEKIKYCLFKKTVYASFKNQKPFKEMSYIHTHCSIFRYIYKYKHTYSQVYSQPSVIVVY